MRVYINDDNFIKSGYVISTDKSLLDFPVIYKYLSEDSYWQAGYRPTGCRKLSTTPCVLAYIKTELKRVLPAW